MLGYVDVGRDFMCMELVISDSDRGRLIFMKRMFEGSCANDNIMILSDFLISVIDFFQLWYQVGYRVLLRRLFYE